MNPAYLWAKSKRPDELELPSMRLLGHLTDVSKASIRVLDATADDQLRALGLDPNRYRERLRRCVVLAAAIHDLGKANDHFQPMVRGCRDVRQNPQGLRHEWVTILVLRELRPWLLAAVEGSDVDFAVVEWAVAGHHPAFHHQSPPRLCPAGAGAEIRVLADHGEFGPILEWLGQTFSLAGNPPAIRSRPWPLTGADNVFHTLTSWAKEARLAWEEQRKADPGFARFVAAVKNTLVAADVGGSALPKAVPDELKRWDWITDSFAKVPRPGELQAVVDERSRSFGYRDEERERFQGAVATSTDRVTFVRAGCGTGKTLAAYLWARDRHPGSRLYFCYPTTGTATEGFRDYLHEPDVNADLFHSRRDVDFEIILTTGPDAKDADKDEAIRVESLDAWATPIVACTVDTVLGLVQNNRRGLYGWPALAGAAFVFDEIHAYDDRLFGALLRFLRDVPGAPALLMTASLPAARREALANTIRAAHGIEMRPIAGPEGLETLPRYNKLEAANNEPLPAVRETLAADGKVLWVCNTVGRVMDAARDAADLDPLIYHSRFKYVDRVERHKKVIGAFKGDGPALAICSQVAEMSLDLSADLLVTDLATVPAVIQRLGRLNRRAMKRSDPTKPLIVIEPENHLPYTATDLEACRAWLGKLPPAGISQRQLADAWEDSADNPPDLVPSAWLDGGPATTVSELREPSPGISVLMQEDVPRVQADRRSLGKYVLPMPPPPRGLEWRNWGKERGVPIAEPGTIDYHEERGAEWRRQ